MSLVDPMPLHPLLRHPHTGRPLCAIGLRADGTPLWPLLGAEGEDDGGDEDHEDEDEDEEEEPESEEGDSEDESKDSKAKSKKNKSDTVSRSDFSRLQNQLRAADKRRAELEKEKEAREREGRTELENAKTDLRKANEAHATLKARFTNLALTNAFLTASAQEKISWHDPAVAQKAADLAELEINEDGTVEGIRDAVKALAKSHKYLVNSGKGDEDEDEDREKGRKRSPSGSSVGTAKTGKGKPKGTFSAEELKRRFPTLS